MRRLAWLLLLLGSCQEQLSPVPPGLRTRLIPLGDEFAVGKPLRFRLELTNDSPFPMVYDGQAVDLVGLQIISGPDGQPVPDIDIPRQSTGHSNLLRPGETVVLSQEWDAESFYQIVRPGRYQVQFTGDGLDVIDAREVPLLAQLAAGIEPTTDAGDQWFREIDKLHDASIRVPSNTVTVELKPGRPSEDKVLAERLFHILPEGWKLGVSNLAKEGEILILLQHLTGLKSETATVEVTVSRHELKKKGARICTWAGSSVYVTANERAATLWPNYRRQVAAALEP